MTAEKKCKYALAAGGTLQNGANNRYCQQLVTTGKPFFFGALSFVLPLGSDLKTILDKATMKLRSNDAIPTFGDYVKKHGECSNPSSGSLGFKRLRVFFIVTYSVCLLIFLQMVFYPQEPKRTEDGQEFQEHWPKRQCIHESSEDLDLEV